MPQPFYPYFTYTPKWKGNRERKPEEQFTVRLRDFPELDRLAHLETLHEGAGELSDTEEAIRTNPVVFLRKTREQLGKAMQLTRKYLMGVENLSFQDGDKAVELKTADDLEKYAPDLMLEIAGRLAAGPGEDELKNSQSPS